MELEDFGKDHWSVFAYAECCCVDHGGQMEHIRLRINRNKRPLGGSHYMGHLLGWDTKYGTRIKDGSIPDPQHDDWDCLEDLEREGLLEIISMVNAFIRLTDEGQKVAEELRRHKMNSEQFSTFRNN